MWVRSESSNHVNIDHYATAVAFDSGGGTWKIKVQSLGGTHEVTLYGAFASAGDAKTAFRRLVDVAASDLSEYV